MEKKPFENLPIRRRDLTSDAPKTYRVYKNVQEFVIASGKTATEALKSSGVENAQRIMLHDVMEETVLNESDLREHVKPVPPVVEDTSSAGPAEAPPADAAAVAPEKTEA